MRRNLILVLTQVCASPGATRTLPAFLPCARIANSATKRYVRRVLNAANMPCGKNLASLQQRITLPRRLQYDVCRLERYVYSPVRQCRILWPYMTHELELLEIRYCQARYCQALATRFAQEDTHHPYHYTSRALIYSHGDAITTCRGYRQDLSAPPSPDHCVWASRAVCPPQASATVVRLSTRID